MSVFQTIWTIIGACITIAGLVIAFARVSPDDAKENLTRWGKASGIQKIPAFFRAVNWERFRRVSAAVITGVGAFITSAAGLYHQYDTGKILYNKYEIVQADEIRDLKQKLAAAESRATQQNTASSGLFKWTDIDRWKYASNLRFQTVNAGNGKPCEARMWEKPADKSATETVAEMTNILSMGSWRLEGGRNARNVFPDGITINVGTDNGTPFNCAYRLSEALQGMNLKPINLRVNIASPDLIECKDCVEIVFGAMKPPQP
ncbi:hypothetical protein ACVWYQ_000766 [Bradyrhizobium sp. USDA 3397]